MSQLVTSEFFRGLKRKAPSAPEESLDWLPIELDNKRIKLNEEYVNVINNSAPEKPVVAQSVKSNLSVIFCNLPREIIEHHIISIVPIEWMYISKYYHQLALRNIDRDPRLKWDFKSLERAAMGDNLPIVVKHLERNKDEDYALEDIFILAAKNGCEKVVKHFLANDSLLREDSYMDKPLIIYRAMLGSINQGHQQIVTLLAGCSWFPELKYNSSLDAALSIKNREIVSILLEHGFYSPEGVIELIQRHTESNDPDLLHLIFQRIDFTITHNEKLSLLRTSIQNNANQVVDYLLGGLLDSVDKFDDYFTLAAVENRSVTILQRLLLDDRFNVTYDTLNRAIFMNSKKMVRLLIADPRLRYISSPQYLFQTALSYASTKIICLILDDPAVEVSSCVEVDLIEKSIREYSNSPKPAILALLNHPRVNFNFYASFVLCTAIQNNCYSLVDAIMKDERLEMDETYYRAALQYANKTYKTHLIQALENVKHRQFGPTEVWV